MIGRGNQPFWCISGGSLKTWWYSSILFLATSFHAFRIWKSAAFLVNKPSSCFVQPRCWLQRSLHTFPKVEQRTFVWKKTDPMQQRQWQVSSTTSLWGGYGYATNYTWKEDAFDIDITIPVPATARAKDIYFHTTARSIELRYKPERTSEDGRCHDDIVLLDPTRKLRGRIDVDGTSWVFSDDLVKVEDRPGYQQMAWWWKNEYLAAQNAQDNDGSSSKPFFCRELIVTLEKMAPTARDDFEVLEYDWKGVYADDKEDVWLRQYDEPEELDVREYAASLGVDIDNINMSQVDKTMFSSNLNLTKRSYDVLNKAGYLQEVTQQADGREYIVKNDVDNDDDEEEDDDDDSDDSSTDDDEDDENHVATEEIAKEKAVPFSPLGKTVSQNEWDQAQSASAKAARPKRVEASRGAAPIPFLDTDSPWHKLNTTNKNDVESGGQRGVTSITRNFTQAAFLEEQALLRAEKENRRENEPRDDRDVGKGASDPIDVLPVERLTEILRSQGLDTTGSKKDLQDRLRQQVNKLLQGQN